MLYLQKDFHRDHFYHFTQKGLLPAFTTAGWQIQAEAHLATAKRGSCISFPNKAGILSTCSILLFQDTEDFDYKQKEKKKTQNPPQTWINNKKKEKTSFRHNYNLKPYKMKAFRNN